MENNGEKSTVGASGSAIAASLPTTQDAPVSRNKSASSAALAKLTSHLTTRSATNPGPPPDGGFLAWIQIFCAWLAVLNSWGFVNSFGAFQPYYTEILPESPSTISWIGSTQACLLFALGMFSGRALDAGYFRPTIIVGIILQILGMFTLSVAKTYWQLLLTQGICTGIGGGIMFVPIMGVATTYFAKNRGLAVGLITSANSVGGVVIPIVVRQLLDKVGFGWTVRVLAFINVAGFAVVVALMKPRLPPRKSGPLWDEGVLKDVPYCLQVLGMCFLLPVVYFVSYYIASFGRAELDMPYTNSLNLVMILNGVGFPARILPGYISDHYLGVLNTFALCVLVNIAIVFSWLAVSSVPSLYAFTVFYGFFVATFQSLFPTTIAALSNDITKTGTRLGMAFSVVGLSALVGGPLSGALVDAGSGYVGAICWAGGSLAVGLGLCVTARVKKFGWGVWVKC